MAPGPKSLLRVLSTCLNDGPASRPPPGRRSCGGSVRPGPALGRLSCLRTVKLGALNHSQGLFNESWQISVFYGRGMFRRMTLPSKASHVPPSCTPVNGVDGMARILVQCFHLKVSPCRFVFRNNRTIRGILRSFAAEERAVAMTEYLILLGLLVGGAIGAVIYVAERLGLAFISWGNFWTSI